MARYHVAVLLLSIEIDLVIIIMIITGIGTFNKITQELQRNQLVMKVIICTKNQTEVTTDCFRKVFDWMNLVTWKSM